MKTKIAYTPLQLYFDWTWIKTKQLKFKSNPYTDMHAFYIVDEDGDILHGWGFQPYHYKG